MLLSFQAPNYEVPNSLLQELSTRNLSPSVLKNVVKLDNDNWLIEECPNKEEVHMHSLVDKQIISDKVSAVFDVHKIGS